MKHIKNRVPRWSAAAALLLALSVSAPALPAVAQADDPSEADQRASAAPAC